MSLRKYFLSESGASFRQAIRSLVGFQTLLAGLLLCATYAVQAETALQRDNEGKVQSGTASERALLFDADPLNPNDGKTYSGFVVWRTETIQQTGEKPDLAIRADIEIPERNLKVAVSIKGNRDLYLSASHKIEISFALQPDSNGGDVGYVHSVMMRPGKHALGRGMILTSDKADPRVLTKVVEGLIIFGLSDRAFNQLQLIDGPSLLLDIYMLYNSRRWGILTIESGASAREAFEKVFAARKGH
jgi:hypothetical protein